MPGRVPVKLTRGEIVLPPRTTQQYRDRLEEMNRIGLQARAAGGVVNYMKHGGKVHGYQVGGEVDPFIQQQNQDRLAHDSQEEQRARRSRYGAGLVHIGSNDFVGASDALAYQERPFVESQNPLVVEEDEDTAASEDDVNELNLIGSQIVSTMQYISPAADAIEDSIKYQKGASAAAVAASAAGAEWAGVQEAKTTYLNTQLLQDVKKGELSEVSFNAYRQLQQRILRLAQRILNTQTGTKTDFDAQNAAAQIADLVGTPFTIYNNFKTALEDVNASLEILEAEPIPVPTEGDTLGGAAVVTGSPVSGIEDNSLRPDRAPNVANPLIPASDEPVLPEPGTTLVPSAPEVIEPEPEEEDPEATPVDFTFEVKGVEVGFTEIKKSDVPDDVLKLWRDSDEVQDKAILGDDGYAYIYYDPSAFKYPIWGKSSTKYGG